MKTRFSAAMIALSLSVCMSGVPALALVHLPQTAGQDIKGAGTETKDAGKDVGHGVAKGTKTGYKKTKNGTKKVFHKTASGTKKVVHGTGKGLEKTGDKIEGKPTPQ